MFKKRLKQFSAYCRGKNREALLLLLGLGVYGLLVYLFVELVDEVLEGETIMFDESVLLYINARSTPLLDSLIPLVTELGGVVMVALVTIAAVALLLNKRRFKDAIIMASSIAGAAALIVILKSIFARDRPSLWEQLVMESSYSFPSGHSIASSALALTTVYLLRNSKYKNVALLLAIPYMVLIGFTRMYLGVHYPTDVIAGWLVSGIWLGIVIVIVSFTPRLLRGRE